MIKKYNIPELLTEVDAFYDARVKEGKPYTKLSATREKIVDARKWQSSLHLIEKNFDKVLGELKVVYIPRVIKPGPMVVFPIRDVDGEYKYAQTKPFPGSDFFGDAAKKYYYLGTEPMGPRWLGNNPRTLKLILKLRKVAVVEGPFDFLACRLLSPNAPVLCPLSKSLTPKHIDYLRLLGVREIIFMYDNEASEKGQSAAAWQAKQMQEFPMVRARTILIAGGGDPSRSLENPRSANQLKIQLDTLSR